MLPMILSAGIPSGAWLLFVIGLLLLAIVALILIGCAIFASTDAPAHRICDILHGPPRHTGLNELDITVDGTASENDACESC